MARLITKLKGFSVVEIIITAAAFALIVTALLGIFILHINSQLSFGNNNRALLLAEEGLEATRNIRDANYTSLVNGSYGLQMSGNKWIFSGGSDSTENFTRQINIADAGANTKLITANISWQEKGVNKSTFLQTYLANWQNTVSTYKSGMLAYVDFSGAKDVIRYKAFDGPTATWGAEQTVPDNGVPLDRETRLIKLYSSATRNEKILVSKHVLNAAGNDQYLYVQVWNGTAWGSVVQLSSWSGVTNPEVSDIDGVYLNNGDFLLVYEDNTNIPKYRTWNGTTWTAQANTTDIGGNPEFIVVKNKIGTNEAMAIIRDGSQDTNTIYFNGTTWGSVTEHSTTGAASNEDVISLAWSITTPNTAAIMYNEAVDKEPNIRLYNGVWGSTVENLAVSANTRALQISSFVKTNNYLGCTKDNGNFITCYKSDLTPSWSAITNGIIAQNTDTGTQRSFAQYFENTGDTALVVYSNGTTVPDQAIPKYRSYDVASNAFSAEMSLNTVTDILETVTIKNSPDTDDLLVLIGASDQDLSTIFWDGTSNAFYTTGGLAQTEHGVNGSYDQDYWFDFAWDKN